LLHLDEGRRAWYEMAAVRHLNREQEIRQAFLDAIGSMFGG
jgi:hypothetical protein